MKKLLIFLLVLFAITGTCFGAARSIGVKVDGVAVKFTDAAPFLDENERTQVPLRAVAEMLKCGVLWDQQSQTAYAFKISNDGTNLKRLGFSIASKNVEVLNAKGNNFKLTDTLKTLQQKITASEAPVTVKMDTQPELINDRTYIPLRYVGELFNHAVTWNQATSTANIITKNVNMTPYMGDWYHDGLAPEEYPESEIEEHLYDFSHYLTISKVNGNKVTFSYGHGIFWIFENLEDIEGTLEGNVIQAYNLQGGNDIYDIKMVLEENAIDVYVTRHYEYDAVRYLLTNGHMLRELPKKEATIKRIQNKFQDAQSMLKSCEHKVYTTHAEAYFMNESLVMLHEYPAYNCDTESYLPGGERDEFWYYSDGEVYFIFAVDDATGEEFRLYFDKGKLIRWIDHSGNIYDSNYRWSEMQGWYDHAISQCNSVISTY